MVQNVVVQSVVAQCVVVLSVIHHSVVAQYVVAQSVVAQYVDAQSVVAHNVVAQDVIAHILWHNQFLSNKALFNLNLKAGYKVYYTLERHSELPRRLEPRRASIVHPA